MRFRNDSLRSSGCTEARQQWRDPAPVPPFASLLFAPDSIPPFDPRTLTDYYHRQSNGQLLLYGEVYPDVYVTEYDDTYYSSGASLYKLSREVLFAVNDDPRMNLSEFDANEDGYLDYVLIVVRERHSFRLSQSDPSGLSTLGYASAIPEFGTDPLSLKKIRPFGSGAYVLYDAPGNIFPDLDLFRLIAHEIGHSIWAGGHRQLIGGAWGVPATSPESIAYILMAAAGDCAGSLTISASERDMLHRNWITCTRLTRDTTVSVRDLYTSTESHCFVTDIRDESSGKAALYLSNRQRIGHFEQVRTESCYGVVSDHGLMATGLLATKVDAGYRMAVLAADNTLEPGLLASGYVGDMFAPPSHTQLTPWTSPSIHGMSSYPPGFELGSADFIAIDSIRYDATDGVTMEFDFLSDFRRAPVFRSDSRIGDESSGIVIMGPAQVAGTSWLTLGTDVSVAGKLLVDKSGGTHVEAGAFVTVDSLHMASGSTLRVDGVLVIAHSFEYAGATIELGSGGTVIGPSSTGNADTGCELEGCSLSLSAYPNPFSGSLTVEMSVPTRGPATVEVFDVLGRHVATVLKDQEVGPGKHVVVWHPLSITAGMYVVRARGKNFTLTKKVAYVS